MGNHLMAVKKSELYSSLWAACDDLRGGMDASQYKDYVLVLIFIKYVSDKYAGQDYASITVPAGASFADLVALKGQKDIGDRINKEIIAPLEKENKLSFGGIDFNDASKLGSDKEMVERLDSLIGIFQNPAPMATTFSVMPTRSHAPLRHREREEQRAVLHPGGGQPRHRADSWHPAGGDDERHHHL